ncbi:hypothetical protein FDK38_004900 [Candidozyma auris]|nr:hypothetical protein FDK38_004900 [[Candida] auris]
MDSNQHLLGKNDPMEEDNDPDVSLGSSSEKDSEQELDDSFVFVQQDDTEDTRSLFTRKITFELSDSDDEEDEEGYFARSNGNPDNRDTLASSADPTVGTISFNFRSYRSLRKFEINIYNYRIGKEAAQGGTGEVIFGEPMVREFNPQEPPINAELSGENCSLCEANHCKSILLREERFESPRILGLSVETPPRKFLVIVDALSTEIAKGNVVSPSAFHDLYRHGSKFVGIIAENVEYLITVTCSSCKQFTNRLQRLSALAVRAIRLFDEENEHILHEGLEDFNSQLHESYADCAGLLKDLYQFENKVREKKLFWQANASETITSMEEAAYFDAHVDDIEEHFREHNDETIYFTDSQETCYIDLYKNAMQFLIEEDAGTLVNQLGCDLSQILVDLKELQEIVKIILGWLVGRLY